MPEVLRTKVKVFVDLYLMASQIKDQAEQRIALAQEQAARLAAEETSRRLREADERKDEFLAMLSHELRNPMSAIRNAVEILKIGADRVCGRLRFARDVDRQSHPAFAPGGRPARHLAHHARQDRIAPGAFRSRAKAYLIWGAEPFNRQSGTNRSLIEARRHKMRLSVPKRPITFNGDFARTVQIVANAICTTPPEYTADGDDG